MAVFYRIPAIGAWLQKTVGISASKGNYRFHYGMVEGAGAPSEFGEFWYRWFPRGLHVYVGAHRTGESAARELRRQIGLVSHVMKAPVLFKNLYNSMRIAPIVEAVPEASFIVCKRDPVENALSILKGRMKNVSNINQWWSVPPKEIDQWIDRDYSDQIAAQIYYIYKQIEEDRIAFGPERFVEIHYEELCADVSATLKKIADFLEERGCRVKGKWEVPAQFPVSQTGDMDETDRERMSKALRNLFGRNSEQGS